MQKELNEKLFFYKNEKEHFKLKELSFKGSLFLAIFNNIKIKGFVRKISRN